MPDLKISQLPVASTPLAGTELVPIVQGGTTDQTTVQAIMTSTVPSGTANGVLYLNGSKVATSGSALTFDGTNLGVGLSSIPTVGSTTVLAVGAANGGTQAITQSGAIVYRTSASTTGVDFFCPNNVPLIWYQSGTEQMRLTSTGLGIGTSSTTSGRLSVQAGTGTTGNSAFFQTLDGLWNTYLQIQHSTAGIKLFNGNSNSAVGNNLIFGNASIAETMRIDGSGNLGLGVTPSAWAPPAAGYSVMQIRNAAFYGISTNIARMSVNAFVDGSGVNTYINNGFATRHDQQDGEFRWLTAPSGTAGNAISFTQSMTLDASGRLGVGTTSPSNIGVTAESTGSNSVYFTANNTTGYNFVAGVATAAGYGLLGMTTNHALAFLTNNTERARITSAGDLITNVNGTAPSLSTNSTMSFELTSNTSLKIVVRGTDGVTRSVSLTLA